MLEEIKKEDNQKEYASVSEFASSVQSVMLDGMNTFSLLSLLLENDDFVYNASCKEDRSRYIEAMIRFSEMFQEGYRHLRKAADMINSHA